MFYLYLATCVCLEEKYQILQSTRLNKKSEISAPRIYKERFLLAK